MADPRQTPLPFWSEGWTPPDEFHEYRLVRPLGRGRVGRVYLAQDTLLERAVAVKFVPVKGGEALMRLLNEARAAARIQHPNVVTLYRVGQLDDYAYLVTEYTQGTSLDRIAKPVPPEQALRFAVDLARGLAAAHRAGVLHRDLKPGNAVLAEDGSAKLLDFGVAKLVDPLRAGSEPPPPDAPPAVPSLPALRADLVGTPYYMAPEAWRGEEHTARSDLYALGALLYDLCCGQAPFRHVPLSALPTVLREQLPAPLAGRAPGLAPGLAAAIDRCLRADPLDRFASADALLDALESAAPPPASIPEGNPYRGLRPFEPEHRALFFGRSRDLRLLRERLRAEPFVLLAGDSGVGKSSLAGAGLLPLVVDGGLDDARRWKAVRLVPGHHPLASVAAALTKFMGFGSDDSAVEAVLHGEPSALARRLRGALGTDRGLLVFVDQLEELVTLAEPREAARAASALASLAQGVPGLRLVATARSDFLTRLAALPRLGGPLARAIHLVRPLDPEDLREAVVGPARIKGVRFESDALVDELVASAQGPGGLPLLQFALAELWEARDGTQGLTIPAAALQKLGGVTGALARHADSVIDALLPEQRPMAQQLLLRLVTDDGTRARRTGGELTGGDPRYRAALEALVRGRLLVAREADGGSTYEVAHEALLSGWSRLAHWIAEETETRGLRRRLASDALQWERHGERPEDLWGPRALGDANHLDESQLDARERRFLNTSRVRVHHGRRTRRRVALAMVGLLLVGGAAVRVNAALERHRQVRQALAAAAEVDARARQALAAEASHRRRAFLAFDAARDAEGERAWARAVADAAQADALLAQVTDQLEGAAALAPGDPEVLSRLAAHLLERELRAERDGHPELAQLLAQRLGMVDPTGEHLKALRAPARLELSGDPARLSRYVRGLDGRMSLEPVRTLAAGARLELEPGSYLLEDAAHPELRASVLLRRGEHQSVTLKLPEKLPPDFAYVPAGRFLYGSGAEESVRQFFGAQPIHPVELPAYLIARHETTWAEYLRYLDALDPQARALHTPRAGSSDLHGTLVLTREDGRWHLTMQPGTERLSAFAGEPMHYPDRASNADVDWLQLPVGGVSFGDAQAYARWLDRSGRVPHARLCTEREWERAARGADGREYPHGDALAPADADFDATYGKDPRAFGPDPVGAHPASRSPFGVDDLAGNVWEWTTALGTGKPVARGGSYYYAAPSCRSTNRETPEASFRELTVGIRICADP